MSPSWIYGVSIIFQSLMLPILFLGKYPALSILPLGFIVHGVYCIFKWETRKRGGF